MFKVNGLGVTDYKCVWFDKQIFQVAPSLHMVQVSKSKGDTLEFHKVKNSIAWFID